MSLIKSREKKRKEAVCRPTPIGNFAIPTFTPARPRLPAVPGFAFLFAHSRCNSCIQSAETRPSRMRYALGGEISRLPRVNRTKVKQRRGGQSNISSVALVMVIHNLVSRRPLV